MNNLLVPGKVGTYSGPGHDVKGAVSCESGSDGTGGSDRDGDLEFGVYARSAVRENGRM